MVPFSNSDSNVYKKLNIGPMVKHSVFIVNTSQLPFHYSDDENHFSAIVFFFWSTCYYSFFVCCSLLVCPQIGFNKSNLIYCFNCGGVH